MHEINEINVKLVEQNTRLHDLNDEKVVLLKEIHHRVKNNLQVITSLLSLQSSFIEDEEVKSLFKYSQFRINSMSVIHEMLYKSDDISKIRYADYLEKLVSGLVQSMKGDVNNISLKFDIPDIELNIDTAIPLGLLITEVVTNSLKYGIPESNKGEITISLVENTKPEFTLCIADDGVGFSNDINFETSSTLGLILMYKLALQLKGNITKTPAEKGTEYILNFQEIG